MTYDFCNFDAFVSGDDNGVYVDNYVETVDYFFGMPKIWQIFQFCACKDFLHVKLQKEKAVL